MKQLDGKLFRSGAIEFAFQKNQWAYNWYSKAAREKNAAPRVVIDPQKISLAVEVSSSDDEDDDAWLKPVLQLLRSADKVYLEVTEKYFRFQKAVYQIKPNLKLITLGAPHDIDDFAKKNWHRIKYFYARRQDDVTFDLKKIYTHRAGTGDTERIELITRIRTVDGHPEAHLSFLASGSGTPNEIIEWRMSVEQGQTKRFAVDGTHLEIKVVQARRPLTFLHEVREEFNNHSFEFEGEALDKQLERLRKKTE